MLCDEKQENDAKLNKHMSEQHTEGEAAMTVTGTQTKKESQILANQRKIDMQGITSSKKSTKSQPMLPPHA